MYFNSLPFALLVVRTSLFFEMCDSAQDTPEEETAEENNLQPEILTREQIAEWQNRLRTIEADPVERGEIAVLETSLGTIRFRFFTDVAPNHSANFKKLANSGFYDWTTFHRVKPGFMIQGGDINSKNNNPSDDGKGSPGYYVDAEFSEISHVRGSFQLRGRVMILIVQAVNSLLCTMIVLFLMDSIRYSAKCLMVLLLSIKLPLLPEIRETGLLTIFTL